MDTKGIHLEANEQLEDWLKKHSDECFPNFSSNKREKSYPERYIEFKNAILPIHNQVEKGAMMKGAIEWMEETKAIIENIKDPDESRRLLNRLIESDPIVYLNNHGPGHVNKVIEKVSEILHFFDRGYLTPYEGFFLLCAIQAHDVGNVFGRKDHEKYCKDILEEKGKPYIPDSFERKVIEKLVLVHGGAFNGEQDTISCLSEKKLLYEKYFRERLLAALLRFGDELADDASRSDRDGIERGTILEGSLIYHHYSQALHTVKIKRNDNEKLQVFLSYEFDSDVASKKFKKNGKDKYLLDEVYDRTLKMERERRYCMRFLRPCISLDAIRVEIVIQCSKNAYKCDKINYTLEESGYPSYPKSGSIKDLVSAIRSGEEEIEHLKREWGL
jgi:hypothetical protein